VNDGRPKKEKRVTRKIAKRVDVHPTKKGEVAGAETMGRKSFYRTYP
jgi:hypothetical protein